MLQLFRQNRPRQPYPGSPEVCPCIPSFDSSLPPRFPSGSVLKQPLFFLAPSSARPRSTRLPLEGLAWMSRLVAISCCLAFLLLSPSRNVSLLFIILSTARVSRLQVRLMPKDWHAITLVRELHPFHDVFARLLLLFFLLLLRRKTAVTFRFFITPLDAILRAAQITTKALSLFILELVLEPFGLRQKPSR